jgi:hypothetical protein
MKPTFIITSAIDTNLGVFPPEVRILQTHETINSILTYYPDAVLVLVEGGNKIADFDQSNPNELSFLWAKLRGRCHVNLNMSSSDQIRHLHDKFFSQVQNKFEMGGMSGLTKTVAELTLMAGVFEALKNEEQLKPALESDRIFKISGRYQLSPMFDPAVYTSDAAKGKYVFRRRDPSWIEDAENKIGTAFGFASRLWSFDTAQLDDVIEKFNVMIEDCLEITNTHYIDIEHLLYKHIGTDNTLQVEHTHLYGAIAPNGITVYD